MHQLERHRKKFFWSAYVFCVSVIILGSIYLGLNLESTRNLVLEKEFQKAQELLAEKVESFVHGLQGMGGLYLAKNFEHNPKDIKTYADFRNNFNNFPGALGFGFIRVVPKSKKAEYEKMMKSISPDFKIKSLGDETHTYFHVIETVEPFIRNSQARFLDTASEKVRRNAALRAIDSVEAILTGALQLVQTDKKEIGFLFYLPLYHTKVPPFEVEERRRQIAGFAYAPVLLKPLMQYLQDYSTEKLYYKL